MKTETLAAVKTEAPSARPRRTFFQRHEALILGGGAVLLALAIWEYYWSTGRISPLFGSGPSAIAKQFHYGWTQGTLRSDMAYSGRNFAVGFAIALGAGVVLGIIIGWYRRVRLVLNPFLSLLFATPRVAMVPLIILWFGIGMKSKVFIVFLSAFFPILINTVAGVRTMDADLLRAARAFCASDWQIFKTLAIPGSVPFILTGVRQGVALGLIGVVVGEMLGASEGIGLMIVYSGNISAADSVFVGVLIIAFAGLLLTSLTERLERRFSRWRPDR